MGATNVTMIQSAITFSISSIIALHMACPANVTMIQYQDIHYCIVHYMACPTNVTMIQYQDIHFCKSH